MCMMYPAYIYAKLQTFDPPIILIALPSHSISCRRYLLNQFPYVHIPNCLPIPPSHHGFINCSFLNHLKKPAQIATCISTATQKTGLFNPSLLSARFGKTAPGPFPSGAVALATIVATLPSTCAHTSANTTWNLVKVCSRIIPKPTPCIASSTPNQSHSMRPTSAPARGEPAQGTQLPMPDVPQSI